MNGAARSGGAAVLFVNPQMCARRTARLPLSLLNLAAVLEGNRPWRIVDGNLDADAVQTALRILGERPHAAVGVTVMPGPQVGPAIQISAAIREAFPGVPIVWGGYFPTLYAETAINAPYVDYVVRGQGEATLVELLARLDDAGPCPGSTKEMYGDRPDRTSLADVLGLTWRRDGEIVHNPERPTIPPQALPPLPYAALGDIDIYFRPSFMGTRTTVHQGAIGCRFKCEFCGVVSMWNGQTVVDDGERIAGTLRMFRDRYGVNGVHFYDHNFFDREESSRPILDALATLNLPWWCYARADTMARFSASTWEKIRRSRLRMAYIGAEAATDDTLANMRKGSRVDHTVEVVRRCAEYGVIPELSFVLGSSEDPAQEIETTFEFIRRLKTLNPASEIVLYYYSPTPQADRAARRAHPEVAHIPKLRTYGPSGPALPTTPEEWAQPHWVRWICHLDAPWLTPQLRSRVNDFARVLACRFPTVQDYQLPRWGEALLRNMARWRYASGRYGRPWELKVAQKLLRLRDPKTESL